MDQIKQFLSQGAELQFAEALMLNDVESKNDPENEPYRSMYKAREMWHTLKSSIDRLREATPDLFNWTLLDAVLDLKLGTNYMDSEEKSTGEEHLARCLSRLEDHHIDVEACCIVQTALNRMGILYSDRGEPQKGLEYLKKAEALYQGFTNKVGGAPWTVNDPFQSDSYNEHVQLEKLVQRRSESFEDTYTHTLYYLAQVNTKLELSHTAAQYCRMTLRRQLDARKYQAVDWAMNAATLSQYYVSESDFPIARHCLASAQSVLKETSEQLEEAANDDASDRIHKAWADLYRCWAKYGLALLEHSKERLYKEPDDIDHQSSNAAGGVVDTEQQEDESKRQSDRFFDLELTAIESRITDKHVCVFDEARQVFKAVQSWLDAAKVYYCLDGHCSEYVEIIQDNSRLYKVLAFFEMDLERQCRMHKRRADMLTELLKVLNQQFYLLVCRQLMFELGEIYSAMLDNKNDILEQSHAPPTEHARAKINSLAQKSIEQFRAYVDSLKSSDGKLPGRFQDDDERPALIAHFYIGRLYSKLIDFDIPTQLRNMKGSLENYKFIVDYCRQNPEAVNKVKGERDVCEEMVVLLPAKMDKIRATVE